MLWSKEEMLTQQHLPVTDGLVNEHFRDVSVISWSGSLWFLDAVSQYVRNSGVDVPSTAAKLTEIETGADTDVRCDVRLELAQNSLQ
jgi:hypothetical protein